MYFWNTQLKEKPWGLQGDVQHRNWNALGDLEQLLLRGGLTYKPVADNANIKFTLGYGYIQTGAFGSDADSKTEESRIYQEALIGDKIGNRFHLKHRFRFEQRFVENQDFRTRVRYALFLNIPLNSNKIEKKTVYIALYDELFINGQRNIGNGNSVEIFDRNRLYGGIGYGLKDNVSFQLGFMRQQTNSWGKNQAQISLHHKI